MFDIDDRVRLAPPFDRTSDEAGTVIGFAPSSTESERYVIVRWDNGTEAHFAPGALAGADQ